MLDAWCLPQQGSWKAEGRPGLPHLCNLAPIPCPQGRGPQSSADASTNASTPRTSSGSQDASPRSSLVSPGTPDSGPDDPAAIPGMQLDGPCHTLIVLSPRGEKAPRLSPFQSRPVPSHPIRIPTPLPDCPIAHSHPNHEVGLPVEAGRDRAARIKTCDYGFGIGPSSGLIRPPLLHRGQICIACHGRH